LVYLYIVHGIVFVHIIPRFKAVVTNKRRHAKTATGGIQERRQTKRCWQR